MIALSKKTRRSLIAVSSVLLFSLTLAALLILRPSTAEEQAEEQGVRQVETVYLEYSPVDLFVQGEGFIRSARTLSVQAMVSGRIVETYRGLKSGSRVEKGTLLVRIDDESARNRLALARVELISATASLLSALRSEAPLYARWSDFFSRLPAEDGPLPNLPQVESEREKLLAGTYGVLSAYYTVREQETALSYYRIVAPFSGVLDGDGADLYGTVAPGEVLFTLTDPANLEISLSLSASELSLLDQNRRDVSIRPAGMAQPVQSGELIRMDGVMRRESQRLDLHVSFVNPDGNPRLLPGNYAQVEIPGRRLPAAFLLPRALLNDDGSVNTLEGGRLVQHPVELLAVQGDSAVLGPSLPEGTELILTRLQSPFPGMELERAE